MLLKKIKNLASLPFMTLWVIAFVLWFSACAAWEEITVWKRSRYDET